MGREVTKTLKTSPSAHYLFFFFLTTVPQMVENTMRNEELEISKNMHFCSMHFSLNKKHILEKPCLKQHAVLVHPLGVSYDFLHTPTLIFLHRQWEGSNQEKGSKIWLPHRNFDPQDLTKGPIPTEKGAPKGTIPAFG